VDKSKLSKSKIKISIIEDSEIHREWLKTTLQIERQFDIVSVDRLAKQGIVAIKAHNSDLVLLDFQLEDLTGLEAAKRISAYNDKVKLFMITAHTETTILERIISDKNIKGLAIKGSSYFALNLKSAIKNVAIGGVYLEPSLLEKLRDSSRANGISNLTRREFEVFIQSNAGKRDERIAEDLNVELAYIKNIKSKIAKKIKHFNVGSSLLNKLIENANPNQFWPEEFCAE